MKIPDAKEAKKWIDQWSELSEFSLELLEAALKKRHPGLGLRNLRLKTFQRLHKGLRNKWRGPH